MNFHLYNYIAFVSMTFILYGYEGNPRTRVALITAAAAGIQLQLSTVNPRKGVNVDEYKAKFPRSNGKIPALEGPGVKLTEVMAISWYLTTTSTSKNLLSDSSSEQTAEVLSWCSWANSELQPTLSRWFLPLIPGWKNPAPYSSTAVEEGKRQSLILLELLEDSLESKDYLVGDELTLADVFVATFLTRGFEWVLDAEWRRTHPRIWTYYQHKLQLECFQKVMGDLVPIEKETPNVNPYL